MPRGAWAALTVTFGGRPRTLAGRGWVSASVVAFGAALAAWYLGATLYFVFHDQLLATLMARQAAAQYDYEDRIASLSMQLDQQTSRALLDRQTLETSVRDLQGRSERLAKRAGLLDQLATRERASSETAPPLRGGDAACSSEDPVHRADNEPGRRADAGAKEGDVIAERLAGVEQRQDRALAALHEPALRLVAKFKAALAEAGVPASLSRERDVGGPFVPLTGAALTFEQDAALVQDALLQANQLAALADRVPLRQPVSGPLEVTSSFGPRLDPFFGRPALHTGVDLRGVSGTQVHATAAGTVSLAASENGYGLMVEVNHGNGLVTRYAHLASASVVPGQHVEAGGILGRVGSTGRTTGPHLHYETRVNGEPVDPTRFLKAGARIFDAS